METYYPQIGVPEDVVHRPANGHSHPVNVGDIERLASVMIGSGLAVGGLRHWDSARGIALALMGGALVYRGVTGHCYTYDWLGVNTAGRGDQLGVPAQQGEKVEASIVLDCPAEKVYEFWTELENLPRFMDRLESVTQTGANRSHWVAKAPLGKSLEWDAETINERSGEMIAWRSLPGSQVDTAGSVWFIPVTGDRTEVRVAMKYDPPGGKATIALAKLIGDDPARLLREELARLKHLLEAGKEYRPARHSTDEVDEASMESFPASDPPAFTTAAATGQGPQKPR